jgi:serine phosphatase RsbU (regulator of sigma subunit)/anti-sigma regulatory factor (Ser/Thr protein kinase)/cbb3-type cytochrome oxidase subunit 3
VAGAILAVATLAVLAAVFSWRQYDDAKKHALNEIDARVVLGKTIFDTYFSGEIAVLQSVASSAAVISGDTTAMGSYFKRVQPPKGLRFPGGLGWVDLDGRVRASSSTSPAQPAVKVADRGYFKTVVATHKPFISAGLEAKSGKQRVIVMAVPTFGRQNKLNGVLAGALSLNLTPSRSSGQTIDLGYEGLAIIDRNGQNIMTPNFARPANTALLAKMRRSQAGMLPDTNGLDGSGGRIVAYTTSPLPGWIIVIDRSPGAVFASARRSLGLELASIAAAALLVIGLLVWLYRRANRNAFAERRRMRIASDLTRSLAEASTPGAAADALAAALAAGQPEALAVVGLPEAGNPRLTLAAFRGAAVPALDRNRESLLEPAAAAYESGEAMQISGQTEVADRFPGLQRDSARHVGALYAAPILGSSGRRLGAVLLLFESPRRLGENDQAHIATHVGQAVQALARTLRQEREHEVAVELQRSLLPEELPSAEGVEFATRYHAGGVGVEVGGDWFDVVRRPDGLLHISVGDVAGRGIPAATLMAQLRNAFRAYALDHDSPAEVTRRLLRHVPEGGMVTTACLTIDPYTRRYRYALAGHPPILLLDRETGEVVHLAEAGAPPLGFASPETIREEEGTLPSRATLIAYTDGLVERRGTSIDAGIDLVSSVLASVGDATAEGLADAVIGAATAGVGADDDAALIVVDVGATPARMQIEIPADPAEMAGLRRRLQAWLELRGVSEDERIDSVLAVHEACINAIEHGYQLAGGTIRLALDHGDGVLRIVVEDHGVWRPPTADPSRGRGILIMETAMHTTRIEHGSDGTKVALEQRLTSR